MAALYSTSPYVPECRMRPEDALKAAMVCVHVARGAPILRAIRDEPLEEADSGWQFLCNSGEDEREAEAQVAGH